MKTIYQILIFLIAVHGAAIAQVVPAATGPETIPAGRSLEYAVRYGQTAQFSTTFPTMVLGTGSGSVTFINGSERRPFTAEYSGGYTWTISGPGFETGQFHRLFLTQGVNSKRWKATISDDASYLPQAPTTGFSGIPGTGEPIGVINPAPASGQSILTLNTHAVENNGSGSLEFVLSNATTISAGGDSQLLRYPDGDGLDTDAISANATIVRALNGRDSLSATYVYADFTYPQYLVTFETNSGLLGYRHKWARNLTTNIAAGPQSLKSSIVIPSSINVTVNASVDYLLRFSSFDMSYNRGTNGGAGYLFGAQVDSVAGNFSHEFGTDWTIGLTGGYLRTAGLSNNGVTNSIFGGAEGTWRISRQIIAFANYTGTTQSSTSALPSTALNQLMQTIGFGIGYSPRPKRVRQ